jgi:hypothetical protein
MENEQAKNQSHRLKEYRFKILQKGTSFEHVI